MTISDGISVTALLVSFVAFVVSFIRGRYERERTLRSQLSEVLRQIGTVAVEKIKLSKNEDQQSDYIKNLTTAFDQQQGYLLQQARYLADQIPRLVTSIEYTAIGYSNALAGDLIAAETYYRRGLDAAKDPSYRLTASTAYAWFLFAQRRFEEAREEYKTGISNRVGSDNFARYQKGMSYRFWGENERFWAGSSMAAQQAFESAASEFRGIDLAEFRNNVLRDLENIRSATAAPPSEPKGGVAA